MSVPYLDLAMCGQIESILQLVANIIFDHIVANVALDGRAKARQSLGAEIIDLQPLQSSTFV